MTYAYVPTTDKAAYPGQSVVVEPDGSTGEIPSSDPQTMFCVSISLGLLKKTKKFKLLTAFKQPMQAHGMEGA